MSRKPPEPPKEGAWTRAIAEVNAETKARADAAGVEAVRGAPVLHAGRERPEFWRRLCWALDRLDGEARDRLDAALRDPAQSEALVGAMEQWEATSGALAHGRARLGIPPGAVAVRLREAREGLPDETALADLIACLTLDGAEIEGRSDAPRAHEVTDAAREYARAARRLRDALARAEAAAPKANAPRPSRAKAARLGLADDLCRALGGQIDSAFWQIFASLWFALDGDDRDRIEPPDMQATREHLKKLRECGDL